MATTAYGTPYVESSDLVSAWPTTSQSVANRLDDISFKGNGVNTQTGTTYTTVLTDAGKTVTLENASAVTVTVPANASVAYETGTRINFVNLGAGTVTIAAGGGVTINGTPLTLEQYKTGVIQKIGTDTWVFIPAASASAMTLVASGSPSAVSSISFNSCFTSTYRNYLIIVSDIVGSTNAALRLRWRASSTDATGSNYKFANRYATFATSLGTDAGNPTDHILIVGATGTSAQRSGAHIYVNAPQIAAYTNHQMIANSWDSAAFGAGMHEQATAYDGFSLYITSGTFSGQVKIYGLQN